MQTIFPSDSDGTKWQKLGANIKEAVTASSIAVPADLTPINSCDSEGTKWYKLGRWLSLIAGGTPAPTTGVGYYTPLELLASRNIVDADAGKWLFNTGGAKTLTLTGSQVQTLSAVDERESEGILNWVNSGLGQLGYWLSRVGGDFSSGIGADMSVVGGEKWEYSFESFFLPSGITAPASVTYISAGGSMSYTFTLSVRTRLRLMLHNGGGRTLKVTDGEGLVASMGNASGIGVDFSNPTFWSIVMPAGTHTLTFTAEGDNPGINGILFDAAPGEEVSDATPGKMTIGQSVQGFQAGAGAITIDPTGNTLVAPGLTTQGPGSWFEIKKIGDNLYHAHGDLA